MDSTVIGLGICIVGVIVIAVIKYREMNEPYRAFVHLISNFDKVDEYGSPRFSRTGEFLSKSRARAIIGKANMELKK